VRPEASLTTSTNSRARLHGSSRKKRTSVLPYLIISYDGHRSRSVDLNQRSLVSFFGSSAAKAAEEKARQDVPAKWHHHHQLVPVCVECLIGKQKSHGHIGTSVVARPGEPGDRDRDHARAGARTVRAGACTDLRGSVTLKINTAVMNTHTLAPQHTPSR
jgi:hypothetical protein